MIRPNIALPLFSLGLALSDRLVVTSSRMF